MKFTSKIILFQLFREVQSSVYGKPRIFEDGSSFTGELFQKYCQNNLFPIYSGIVFSAPESFLFFSELSRTFSIPGFMFNWYELNSHEPQ